MAGTRVVICSAAYSGGPFELPASEIREEHWFPSGGERSLYELAVAASSLDLEVELRGVINARILRTLTTAAGAAPRVDLPPRRPDPGDIVVLPEAPDLDALTALAFSQARLVMYLLAPPGLWGWSFEPGWERPDPLSVPLDSLGRPVSFQAISSFGFNLWTNSHGIAGAGERAGVNVEWIGTGTPVPFPEPVAKTCDVALLEHNRWRGWAEQVVEQLDGVSVRRIPPTPSVYSLSEQLAPARILVWPSRVEGMSRIQREARIVGTVPVALNTNPFATSDDHGEGVVLVDDLDSLTREARTLLADRERLERLAGQAVQSAARQTDWNAFVGRVQTAIHKVVSGPPAGSDVMDALGQHSWKGARRRAEESAALIDEMRARLTQREHELASLQDRCESLSRDLERHRAWLDGILSSWSWRLTAPLRKAKRPLKARRGRQR